MEKPRACGQFSHWRDILTLASVSQLPKVRDSVTLQALNEYPSVMRDNQRVKSVLYQEALSLFGHDCEVCTSDTERYMARLKTALCLKRADSIVRARKFCLQT